jgi:hypothetical protein
MQFVQQFHADDFTVAPSAPRAAGHSRQWVSSSTRPPLTSLGSSEGRMPRLATPGRAVAQAVHQHREDAAGRRLPVRKRRLMVRKPSSRPSLRPCTTWPLMLYGRPSRPQRRRPCRRRPRLRAPRSWRRAGRAPRSCSCGPRRSPGGAGGVQHGVVARTLGAEAEVVAHQHVPRAQAAHQHVVDEGLGRLAGQPRASNGRTTHWSTPQRASSVSLSRRWRCGPGPARACGATWRRSSRADAARSSARSWARRGAGPRCSAAPAWPGGRGARRRSCRSSRRRPGDAGGGGSLGKPAWGDIFLIAACARRQAWARHGLKTAVHCENGILSARCCLWPFRLWSH